MLTSNLDAKAIWYNTKAAKHLKPMLGKRQCTGAGHEL